MPTNDPDPAGRRPPTWLHGADASARAQLAALTRRASLGTMTAAMVHDIASIVQGLQCAIDEIQYLVADQLEASPALREAVGSGAEMSTRMLDLFQAMSHLLRHRNLTGMPSSVEQLVNRARLICDAYVRTRATVRIGALPEVSIEAGETVVLQTLVNLIRNAAEASPPGGIIDLEVFDEGDWIRFVVTDDGPGVPPELEAALFEPFVTTKGEGFGLGLALSAAVLAEHGGALRHRRAPGRGAAFAIVLPKDRSAE